MSPDSGSEDLVEPEGVNAGSAEAIDEEHETAPAAAHRRHEHPESPRHAESPEDLESSGDTEPPEYTEAQHPGPSGARGPTGPGQELSAGES